MCKSDPSSESGIGLERETGFEPATYCHRGSVYAWTSSRTHTEYYDHVSWKRGSSSTVGEVGGVRITFKATGKFVLLRSGWPDCVATARVEIVGAVGSGGVVTWNTESYSESFLFIPYFSGACWSNP